MALVDGCHLYPISPTQVREPRRNRAPTIFALLCYRRLQCGACSSFWYCTLGSPGEGVHGPPGCGRSCDPPKLCPDELETSWRRLPSIWPMHSMPPMVQFVGRGLRMDHLATITGGECLSLATSPSTRIPATINWPRGSYKEGVLAG